MINSFIVKSVSNIDSITIEKRSEYSWIICKDDNSFFMVKKSFGNNAPHRISENPMQIDGDTIYISKPYDSFNTNTPNNSFIFDMNGIDNFMFAKSMHFSDSLIRSIVLKFGMLNHGKKYLRIGASGAPKNKLHPGGEVLEYMIISGKDASGIALNTCGYLESETSMYSQNVPLSYDNKYMLENRVVYSHTAWIENGSNYNSHQFHLKVFPKKEGSSLLALIDIFTRVYSIKACAIQIYIKRGNEIDGGKTIIKGRVLKKIPTSPFIKLIDATNIAVEQTFELPIESVFFAAGTKYERYEPDWETFTGGRKYERYGHLHGTINGSIKNQQLYHHTFHVRDIIIFPSSDADIVITPITSIYRTYPVQNIKGKYFCKSNGRSIDEVVCGIMSIN